jgi:serine/threonine protein kinase
MLTGLPPYFSKDTNEMYNRILGEDISFPPYLRQDSQVVDLLRRLLAKDQRFRIKSVSEIKKHPWLRDTDWNKVLNKSKPPPFIPSMRETNFDPEFNEMPVDFDELEVKFRLTTERRFSYYIESTLQSKTCTENSFYHHNHVPILPIAHSAF